MSEADGIRATLDEIDEIVNQMRAKNDLNTAIQFAVRGLDVRRSYYGLGSLEFERARLHAARMVLEAASAQQIVDRLKECAELLAQVDNFTTFSLQQLPELEHLRLLIRFRMMKELMMARHRQGRSRSALTFGRHLLDLGKKLQLVHELPTVHLNIASVYSAMKMHHEALTHCFFGFQKTCMILNALQQTPASSSAPSPFIATALAMEASIREQDDAEAYRLFQKCHELHSDEMEDTADEQAAVPPLTVDDLSAPARRWGGVLALAYRSIAVEQEHLEQFASSSLTYKMAHTTAMTCLGQTHPVTLQCEQSFKDAEAASKYRERRNRSAAVKGRGQSPLKVVRVRSTARTILADISKVDAPPKFEGSRATSRGPADGSSCQSLGPQVSPSRGKRVQRPLWNQWFNSTLPASEYAELAKIPHTAPADRTCPVVSPAVGLDTSALEADETTAAGDPDLTEIPRTSSLDNTRMSGSQLPPRASTSQSLMRPSRHQVAVKAARSASAGGHTVGHHSYLAEEGGEDLSDYQINDADYSFLTNTFKLPYDINFRRPNRSVLSSQGSGRSELRALAAEKRLAEAMAAELGIR